MAKPSVAPQVLERRNAFFRHFREALEARDMSQNELARELQRMGLKASPGTVNGWLNYGRMPGGDYMLALPHVLRVSGHWLLTGRGPRELPGGRTEAQQIVAEVIQFAGELARRYGVDGLNHPAPQSDAQRLEIARQAVRELERVLGLQDDDGDPGTARAP